MSKHSLTSVMLTDDEKLRIEISDAADGVQGGNFTVHVWAGRSQSFMFFVGSLDQISLVRAEGPHRVTMDVPRAGTVQNPAAATDRWYSGAVPLAELRAERLVTDGEYVVGFRPGQRLDSAGVALVSEQQANSGLMVVCTENGPVRSNRFVSENGDNRLVTIFTEMMSEARDWVDEQGREPNAVTR